MSLACVDSRLSDRDRHGLFFVVASCSSSSDLLAHAFSALFPSWPRWTNWVDRAATWPKLNFRSLFHHLYFSRHLSDEYEEEARATDTTVTQVQTRRWTKRIRPVGSWLHAEETVERDIVPLYHMSSSSRIYQPPNDGMPKEMNADWYSGKIVFRQGIFARVTLHCSEKSGDISQVNMKHLILFYQPLALGWRATHVENTWPKIAMFSLVWSILEYNPGKTNDILIISQ